MLPTAARLASAIRADEMGWGTEAVDKDWGVRPAEVGSGIEPEEPAVRIALEIGISHGVAREVAGGEAHSEAAVEGSTDRAHAPAARVGPRACVEAVGAAEAADGADK